MTPPTTPPTTPTSRPTRPPVQRSAPTGGPDEETIRIERELFEQRRRESASGRGRRPGRLRRRLLAVLLVVLVAAGAYVVGWSPLLAADRVEVHGTRTITPGLVRRTAAVPLGRPMVRLDLDAVRARLSTIPAVLSTRVSRSWPGTVRIDVTERTPVAVVPRGGSWRALSPEGVLFRRYAERPEDLPEIQDETGTDQDALEQAARVVGAMPRDLLARVDHVSVATVDRIELTLRGGRTVVWGSSARSSDKARVLAALLSRPSSSIDVSVPSRPTTRG